MFEFLRRKKEILPPPAEEKPEHPLGDLVNHQSIADLETQITDMTFQVIPSTSAAMDSCSAGGSHRVSLRSSNAVAVQYFANTSSFIGYNTCALLAQHSILDRACSLKAQDGVRNWFKLSSTDEITDDMQEYLEKTDQKYKLKSNLISADKFKNIFGIRHILFKVDSTDPDYYLKPFNVDSVTPGSYKGMHQVSPIYMIPEFTKDGLSNPLSSNFMRPLYWVVNGTKIHRSHFVILYGSEVADFLKPTYRYGGVSLVQQIYERLHKAERTANEAPEIALNKRTLVHKMNTSKIAANPTAILSTMEAQNQLRNNHGQMIVDTDDEVQQLDTSLSDFKDLIQGQYQLVAAQARIPYIKLLQDSPTGLSQTGTFEIADYNESVSEVQENELGPILFEHYRRLIRSEICPKFGVKPFDFTIVWEPVDNPTSAERATTNNLNAQTDLAYQQAGALTQDDVRERLSQDRDSPYYGIDGFIPEEERAEQPLETEQL